MVGVVAQAVAIDGTGCFGIAVEFRGNTKRQGSTGIGRIGIKSSAQFGTSCCGLVHGEQRASIAETGGGIAGIASQYLAEQCGGRIMLSRGGGGISHAEERRGIIRLDVVSTTVEDGGADRIAVRTQCIAHAQRLRRFNAGSGRGRGRGPGGCR